MSKKNNSERIQMFTDLLRYDDEYTQKTGQMGFTPIVREWMREEIANLMQGAY